MAELLARSDGAAREELARVVAELDVRVAAGERDIDVLHALVQAGVQQAERLIDAHEGHGGFASAWRAARALGDAEISAWVAWRESLALRDAGDYDNSDARLVEGLVPLGEASQWKPWLLLERAELARARGAWSSALEQLEAARAALRDGPDFPFHGLARASIHGAHGQLLIELGLPDRAAPWIELELASATASGDADAWLAAQLHAANLELSTDDFAGLTARVESVLAREDVPRESLRRVRGQLLFRLGVARSEESRLRPEFAPEARDAFDEALASALLPRNERARAELFLADLELRRGELAEAAQRIDAVAAQFAAALAAAAHAAGGSALQNERLLLAVLRARLALQRAGPRAELEAAQAELVEVARESLDAWAELPLRDGGLGVLRMTNRRALWVELVRVELALRGDAQAPLALEWLQRAQRLSTVARAVAERASNAAAGVTHGAGAVATPAGTSGLRAGDASAAPVDAASDGSASGAALPPGWGCLQYVPGPERSYVYVVDRAGHRVVELASRGELERLRRAVGDPFLRGTEPSASSTRALADALVPASVASWIAAHSHVLFAGLDPIGYVPVEWLAPQGGGPLGLALALAHAPSLALALQLVGVGDASGVSDADALGHAGGASARSGDVVLCIASDPGAAARERFADLVVLPDPDAHAAAVRARFAPRALDALVGADATRVRLAAALAKRPSALLLWAHGVRDGSRELPLGLALAPVDGAPSYLWTSEFETLELPPLVVLASCGAARGPDRPGDEGVAHFGGAALRAGARCVVLPTARIGYRATQVLMEAFESELARGAAPVDALLVARRHAALQRVASTEWAALQLFGCGLEPLVATSAGAAAARASSATGRAADAIAQSARAPDAAAAADGEGRARTRTLAIAFAVAIATALLGAWVVARRRARTQS